MAMIGRSRVQLLLLVVVCVTISSAFGFLATGDVVSNRHPPLRSETNTRLFFFWRKSKNNHKEANQKTNPTLETKTESLKDDNSNKGVSICVVGGGVAGLIAALTASKQTVDGSILLLEASDDFGGRVRSDVEDGYVLDRGFAVFIEEYPLAKELLDYDSLQLQRFLPGALVKLKSRKRLARIANPIRQPRHVLTGLLSPVGTWRDKLKLLPLIINIRRKSIPRLFDEDETNTRTALQQRWGFSERILDGFFKPFLEGIYLSPLEEQSSRMFSFVIKMFSKGSVSLPRGGIGAVAEQLAETAANAGVDLCSGRVVTEIVKNRNGGFVVGIKDGKPIQAEAVIVATEGAAATRLLSEIQGFALEHKPQEHRSVGCLYYSFDSEPPVKEPILILSGEEKRNSKDYPVNNICFPSVINKSYAPAGKSLCSVTVLKNAMEAYEGRDQELDGAVRKQLADWFPESDVETWELVRIYRIHNAQPPQLGGPFPANVHGGRDCTIYRGQELPEGLFVSGDHMATATLNGALESGVNAGKEAAKFLA